MEGDSSRSFGLSLFSSHHMEDITSLWDCNTCFAFNWCVSFLSKHIYNTCVLHWVETLIIPCRDCNPIPPHWMCIAGFANLERWTSFGVVFIFGSWYILSLFDVSVESSLSLHSRGWLVGVMIDDLPKQVALGFRWSVHNLLVCRVQETNFSWPEPQTLNV